METAPLTLAHAHARNASAETWKANSSQASDEHQQAAGEFAKASQGTGDAEALRILKLLESHHHRLATIIKCNSTTSPTQSEPPSTSHQAHETTSSAPPTRSTSPKRTPTSPPRSAPRRKPPRDLSSSIASNLASARGIPGSRRPAAPAISAQHVDGRILGRADRALPQDIRKDGLQQSAKSSMDSEEATQVTSEKEAPSPPAKPSSDEGFKRFFSTFETFYSALSAPLAFTGLPLINEEQSQPPPPPPPQKPASKSSAKQATPSTSVRADSTPNVNGLFSQATLRALDSAPSGGESFIVVPTTGGTVSYAGILNHNGNQTHGGVPSPIIEEEERSFDGEEFVDAFEEPAPPSPTMTRSGKRARPSSAGTIAAADQNGKGGGSGGSRKTMEELDLENTMMRQLLDKLSKRLHMWEASSQSQSLALAQSFRAHRPAASSSAANSEPQTPGAAAAQTNMEHRLRELEVLVESLAREKEFQEREKDKLARENEKLLSVLGRYREKWEVLKAGARGRRERGATGNGNGGREGSGDGGGSGSGDVSPARANMKTAAAGQTQGSSGA
ncbi:hypothetical protein IWZ00DRAFT_217310 [Phyllosticta capitalensis]|uniref:Uncharacterized protein n=1 Tax=Phyllosticta capitalensis TaxID=121624 RepID=A0ABR1YTN0_9PEZI